jgi:hypothetical protein
MTTTLLVATSASEWMAPTVDSLALVATSRKFCLARPYFFSR